MATMHVAEMMEDRLHRDGIAQRRPRLAAVLQENPALVARCQQARRTVDRRVEDLAGIKGRLAAHDEHPLRLEDRSARVAAVQVYALDAGPQALAPIDPSTDDAADLFVARPCDGRAPAPGVDAR